ncbi:MAG: hypothetical protein ACRC2T_06955, partial [Thermoguttaceae bacterium]
MQFPGNANLVINLNAFLWGLGNGLISTSLLVYLIRDLCIGKENVAVNATIAWILAAPRIAGLLRLVVPQLVEFVGSRKWFTICAYFISPLALLAIPLGIPRMIHHQPTNLILTLLVLAWCVYHLIEYFGTTAYWSWLGDYIPDTVRGQVLGLRERFMVSGQMIGFLSVGLFSFYCIDKQADYATKYSAYFTPAYIGIVFLALSAVPLCWLRDVKLTRYAEHKCGSKFSDKSITLRVANWFRNTLAPLSDRQFLLLVIFGVWLQV